MSELVPFDGKLSKYTNVVKGWQNRYFILNPHHGVLEYHISQNEALGSSYKPRGSLLLAGAVIAPSIDDAFTFSVNAANGEVYKLKASSTKERQEWMSHLRSVAHHFTTQIAEDHPPLTASSTRKPRSRSVMSNIGSNLNKIKDQVHNLGPPNASNDSQESRTTLNDHDPGSGVQRHTERLRADSRGSMGKGAKMFDVKRSLPTSTVKELRDAREVLVSADNYQAGVVSMLDSLHYSAASVNTDPSSVEEGTKNHSLALDNDVLLIKSTSTAMLQSLSNCYTLLHKYYQHITSALPSNAEISWVEPRVEATLLPPVTRQRSVSNGSDATQNIATFEVPSIADPNDEVEDSPPAQEDDLGPVDEHKNIIMHLLSQLKLGMDLTKVTLPTFILEKRSLLEMYADFVSHSDLFLSIPDGSSPEDRMCRVLKFYLSSFHCGRHGQIAKKPYNPIVGEVFQCSYHVPKQSSTSKTSSPSSLTHYRVRFISEQVSHHPPVSAFYVSCSEKNVRFNSHIWTKSKFMNMSVGVVNVGEGILSLSDHNENYVVTYPSSFARSILTVPWAELGGRCSITCEKTGLTATVVFHTKPMYGGQPHRVTAEVKNSTGFITCKVDGKWNTELKFMHYKTNDEGVAGSNTSSNEIASHTETVDLSQLPVFPKYLRPLSQQSRMESRKLWEKVTESLRNGDVSNATQYKSELEVQQRQVEKQRKETKRPVPTAYFTLSKGKEYDTYIHKEFLNL